MKTLIKLFRALIAGILATTQNGRNKIGAENDTR